MESTARSPIFSGFTETLEGVVTIRAFAKEASFIDNLQSQVDKSHAAWSVPSALSGHRRPSRRRG